MKLDEISFNLGTKLKISPGLPEERVLLFRRIRLVTYFSSELK